METGEAYALTAKVVINATGVFSDAVRRMDDPEAPGIITPSQGVHIVLDKSFMPCDTAIMVPHTDDGRVLFAIPWKNRVVVGTTDTEMAEAPLDPCPLPEEIDFLLSHAARYLTKDPTREDILSAFAGLRPLVSLGVHENTAAISRDHTLNISRSGLITIAGGKWTTYRKMAEDTVDQAALLAQLQERPSVTKELNIHGFHQNAGQFGHLAVYGSDAVLLHALLSEDPRLACPLHPAHPYLAGEVVWAVRREMARTVEDFLSRRRRVLIIDARASMEMAPEVARLMARELGRDSRWESDQTAAFEALARGYLADGVCPARDG
jgi:glycerol-3-phosphate dehydrogenase